MIYRIAHTTRFAYDAPAYESHNEVRLAPRNGDGQRVVAFRLDVEPPATVLGFEDVYGNRVHAVSVHPPHDELVIVARSAVERHPPGSAQACDVSFAEFLAGDMARTSAQYDFLAATTYVPFSDRLRRLFWNARPEPTEGVAEYVTRIVRFVRDQFEYEPGSTHVHSTVDGILEAGGGVCQDFAHLTLGVLRLAGVPARYVSGYLAPLEQGGATTPLGEQATHAWIEVLLPGQEWVGFDPTHRCRTAERHLHLAIGRDYADVPPVRGVYRSRGAQQRMRVEVSVEPDPAVPGYREAGDQQ